MSKAAFACWDNRIAPVFDTAREIRLVETDGTGIAAESREQLGEGMPAQRALRLAELGVDTLVCGAISRPLHEMVVSSGIRVFPFVAGDLQEIIRAWRAGALRGDAFAMPGCCGRGGWRGRGRGRRGGYRRGGPGR
jgi:predicted Fe-Mo cluster-binding NifX family protein